MTSIPKLAIPAVAIVSFMSIAGTAHAATFGSGKSVSSGVTVQTNVVKVGNRDNGSFHRGGQKNRRFLGPRSTLDIDNSRQTREGVFVKRLPYRPVRLYTRGGGGV